MNLKKQAIALVTIVSLVVGVSSAYAKTLPTESKTLSRGYSDKHKGLDIIPKSGTKAGDKIMAAYDGKVVQAGFHSSKTKGASYGYLVVIDHTVDKKKIQTWYAHLDKEPLVSTNDKLKEGDQIGVMGTTGDSTGVHLHFEVRSGSGFNHSNERLNPSDYFPEYKVKKSLIGDFEEIEDHGELDLSEGTFYSIEEIREMTPEQREELGIPLE
ncbi:peptidase M23 family protein [Brevibacillus laterosporus GI-9]|uniref:M23 family metallopeptidase n=1 Tax=Brevibacillus laterosporus TaxID=1465 RepID=UPI0002404571|nr:M23 family metallopeptidase [Brevibacillus laterosporus]CCF12731.1 peptidase M23 family protein [Brevibacillus laterosporus GI-9]